MQKLLNGNRCEVQTLLDASCSHAERSLVTMSIFDLFFWTRKINVCSFWLSFSKIVKIKVSVWSEIKNISSNWFFVWIQFNTLSNTELSSGGTAHSQRVPVCLDGKRKGFNCSVNFHLSFARVLLRYHRVIPCVAAPSSLSTLTGMSRWATSWFLAGKTLSLQDYHCACTSTTAKRPVADEAMEMGFLPLERSLEIKVATHQHVLFWQ